jgi:hypothetical protein
VDTHDNLHSVTHTYRMGVSVDIHEHLHISTHIHEHFHMMGFGIWVQFRAGCATTPTSSKYLFDGTNSVTSSYTVSHHHS